MLYYSGWSGVQVNLSCPLAMSFIQKKTLKEKKSSMRAMRVRVIDVSLEALNHSSHPKHLSYAAPLRESICIAY